MTKTKLTLAAALLVLTGSAAFAKPAHQNAPLVQREVSMPTTVGQGYYESNREFAIDNADRASSPYAGGGE